jgi:heme/copper-type cytochrome/quinol oxidase subunit 2
MRGFVTVLSTEEFQEWMDDEQAKLKETGDPVWK